MSLLNREPSGTSVWKGDLPITNRYTYGIASEKFFRALKDEGRILGTHCPKCKHTYVPANTFCEKCFSMLDNWIDVGLVGEIFTYTFLYKNVDGSIKEDPEIVAFIKIADGGIIHRISEINPENIFFGMKVAAILKPQGDRKGSIDDIQFFKPV